ncbi:hypothetical protein JANAI62_31630 [Jannaschia pagri]|uniref:Fucosyltransferase C-terminal domain-containing protein n=1 Tax=Jannaschia pagri TaxID=2829797 RepID=A0ABQ4NQI4_9RHOB|nr:MULTISPECIES: glycosyltransferase family 10 [unclassified Jannaschia]GIT92600.1 hypothetical protein JANAI61_30580 [Jannaschia sp. AI_61]GIT96540.1 hypothetical protein JANAI62_31630 [Jannaschia sp. AI_62]
MTAVAIVPYGTDLRRGLGAVPLDALDWPLGRPERLRAGTVADMARDDHLITYPKTSLWARRLPRCRVSLMVVEPRAIHARHLTLSRIMGWRFHRILTRDEATLRHLRNARFFHCADTWIEAPERLDTTKTAEVSLIASAKRDLEGHRLRHAVVEALPEGAPVDVMGRGYKPFEDKSDGLAPYRYSVVIENSRERGYITEKLIDAVLCRTIPIYWGAPDVGDYLDTRGLIICETLDDILAAIDGADAAGYAARAEAVEANHTAGRLLGDLHGRAARLILEEET